ncbi:mycothiol transferase [Jatrophihabitans sp. YIM 134969]
MTVPFPEATTPQPDRKAVLLGYLDFFRSTVAAKLRSLPEGGARRSVVPSGWTPLELVVHLTAMERRWLVWGFEGVVVGDPWRDTVDDRWFVAPEVDVEDVLTALTEQGAETRRVVAAHDLEEIGAPSERWDSAPPATLERVLLHVFQEYARHAGHLDVVVELAGGATGE